MHPGRRGFRGMPDRRAAAPLRRGADPSQPVVCGLDRFPPEILVMILSPSDFRNGKRRGMLRWSGWFFFANWLLLLLISTRYLGALTLPEAWGGRAFTALAFVGHFASI